MERSSGELSHGLKSQTSHLSLHRAFHRCMIESECEEGVSNLKNSTQNDNKIKKIRKSCYSQVDVFIFHDFLFAWGLNGFNRCIEHFIKIKVHFAAFKLRSRCELKTIN